MLSHLEALGKVFFNYSLKKHTSWWVGGDADCCFFPRDKQALLEALKQNLLPKPITLLGLGSNVLVRDRGVRGTVCITLSCLNDLSMLPDGRVYAGAGVTCAKFARFCAREGLGGAAFFSGVPGTIGGALAMNAGAFGGETWTHVDECEVVDESGKAGVIKNDQFEVGYRYVKKPYDLWFLGAVFALPRVKHDRLTNDIKHLLKKRSESQPIGEKSCGSVFRNPKGDFAARLIEASGCKGMRRGGAEVSNKHANFIVNRDNASAEDIETLALTVQARVQTCFDVVLQPEFHTILESVMSQLSVLLITGGISGERHISLISAHNIWKGLESLDLAVFLAFVDEKGRWFLIQSPDHFFSNPNGYPLLDQDQLSWQLGERSYARTASHSLSPDVVFPMVHGTLGEDGALQGFLTMAHLPFVGCDVLGAAVNMHKGLAKRLWKQAGLPVVPWLEVARGQSWPSWSSCVAHLGEHLFVKVDNQGSSLGVYEVTSEIAYKQAIDQAMCYGSTVLIEQAVTGREIEVAVLLEADPVVSSPGEIQLKKGFYDFSAKYDDTSTAEVKVPADLTENELKTAQALALRQPK